MNYLQRQLLSTGVWVLLAVVSVVGLASSIAAEHEREGPPTRLPQKLDVQSDRISDTNLIRLSGIIEEVEVQSPTNKIHGRLNPDNEQWYSVDPPHVRLDVERIAALVGILRSLKAVPQHSANRSVSQRPLSAMIKVSCQGRETTVEVLDPCSEDQRFLWARIREGQERLMCVDMSQFERMLTSAPETWHDTRLFTLRVDEVESAAGRSGVRRIEISRDGTGFVAKGLDSPRLALQTGNDYLGELLSKRGEILGDSLTQPPFLDSRDFIEIRSSTAAHKSDLVVERLILGPVMVDGARMLRRSDDGVVLKVDRATAESLQLGALARAE